MQLSVDDLKDNRAAIVQAKAGALSSEIRAIEAKLRFPQDFRGMVTGSGIGYLLGGLPGAGIAGLLGYATGKNTPLSIEDKQILINILRQKKAQLAALQQGKALGKQAKKGIMSATDLSRLSYDAYDLQGKWFDLVGKPEKPFHAMVFGVPKNGKSIFCFQFAGELSGFGRVLYVASEEGFGGTLQKKITDFGLANNPHIDFSNAKTYDNMVKSIPGHEFVFIDSVDFAKLTVDQIEALKERFPGVSFITVHQATKGGQFRGSQELAHNCDIIIEVIEGVAFQKGRFQAASQYVVFEKKEEKKESEKKGTDQLELFDI